MASVKSSPSKVACAGAFAGMLLLAFAGTLVVMTPSSLSEELPRRLSAYADQLANLQSQAAAHNAHNAHNIARVGASIPAASGIQLLIGLLFAFLYNKKAVQPVIKKMDGTLDDKGIDATGEDDFENGICGCFDDKWVLIHGLCCPLVRMAHTNAVAGIMGFWQTACCWICCSVFTGGLGTCCLMVHWRKELKGIMGIEDHIFNDICVTLFCPLLSVCQQGTAVDRKVGYEVTGCCDLEWNDYE